ncbi:MAG: helicase associated domain-containing protein [Planctomycetaceae bacterium]|nr:helicase associated domain-containing protein [Planctomycetaceae bacterium]
MWEDRLQALLSFRQAHGHLNVPRHCPEYPGLGAWVINQRRLLRLHRLPPERLARLESLDIRWCTAKERARELDRRWNGMCDLLAEFLREHGHCDVPGNWPRDPDLARWVLRQRHLLRADTLREDRQRRLEQCGIDWSLERGRSRARDRAWDRLFRALAAFRKTHGHCAVPKSWPALPALPRWVRRQRMQLRQGLLREDRRGRLETLGLNPGERRSPLSGTRPRSRKGGAGIRERAWRRHYEALAAFRAAQGHAEIPRRFPENRALARWVSHQRNLRNRGLLRPDRVALLESLQFSWSGQETLAVLRASAWESGYSRLEAYRLAHGDCNVPARWEQDPALGRWVAAQRTLRRQGRLEAARSRRLTQLGFDWRTGQNRPARAAF